MPPGRTPKSGLVRAWMLMPERKKLIVVAVVSVLGFWAFRAMFFSQPQHTYQVSHVLTVEEQEEIRQLIIAEERAKHGAELAQIRDEADAIAQYLSDKLEEEKEKEDSNEELIAELTRKAEENEKSATAKIEAKKEEFKNNLPGIISDALARKQKAIIEERADEMLVWFCEADIEDPAAATPVTESTVDLREQPCIGVASQGDPAVPVRRYLMKSAEVSRAVASQALSSLQNRTDGTSKNSVFSFTRLATSEFKAADPCCDSFVFSVHPVFGVFYKLRLPLVDKDVTVPEDDGFFVRSVCFRRKFHPQPVVKAMSKFSDTAHLTDPSKLLDKNGKRKLAAKPDTAAAAAAQAAVVAAPADRKLEDAETFRLGTVHVVLPFRAEHMSLLPSLLKNFGRLKRTNLYNDNTPFRIIIAPVSWESDYMDDAKDRVQDMIKLAADNLDLSITLAEPLAESDRTKPTIVSLIKQWLDTTKTSDVSESTDPAPEAVEDNPWLAAILGALKLVPKARSPVLILDSATYSMPNGLVKKTLWRIISGRMIYSPISSSVVYPVEAGLLLSDGGASKSLAEISETGEDPKYKSAEWWADADGVFDDETFRRRLRANPDAKLAPAAGTVPAEPKAAPTRRVLRPAPKVNTKSKARRGRRLEEGEGEGEGEGAGAEDPLNDDDDWYYDESLGAAGEDFDDLGEWDQWDPALLDDLQDGYGLGYEEGGEDEFGMQAYYFGELGDGYADFEDEYELDEEGSETRTQYQRVTTLAAAKSDIAAMVYRMLETPRVESTEKIAHPQADNCILQRMLSVARRSKYRIVRNVVNGLYVDSSSVSLGASDPEVYPCACEWDSSEAHCRAVFPLTALDDPIDETRVNCVLTSLMASKGETVADVEEKGKSEDIDVGNIVQVAHAVRFFKPNQGVEIVAKVLAAPHDAARRLEDPTDAQAIGPEVFAFQWNLGKKIRALDDVPMSRR